MATFVQSLNPGDPWYEFVKNKFHAGWVHRDKRTPSIRKILLLNRTTSDVYAHERYRDTVQALRGDANLQYQFHGTDRTCYLGDSSNALNLCYRSDCRLCSILRSSFNISLAGNKHSFKRFGNGIYTSSASSSELKAASDSILDLHFSPSLSEADSYSDTNMPSRRYHAMILAEVVVGSTKQLYKDNQHLVAPPWPHDSVTGVPSTHGLNYPETVVYRREAICPKAVVIYKRSEEQDSCVIA